MQSHVQMKQEAARVTWLAGTAAANGNNTVVAAPGAGARIVVVYAHVQNASATASTAQFTNGERGAAGARFLGRTQGAGQAFDMHAHPWRLDEDKALILNLSGANAHGYTVGYYIEAA